MDAPLRAAPLRYSEPSTARFVILILAVLCNGLFVGNAVHNVVAGGDWAAAVLACDTGAVADDAFERQRRFEECAASAEQTRTAYALAGGALALLSGLAVAIAAPAVIRRRRGLTELPPQLAATTRRVHDLAEEAGVRRAPQVRKGLLGQRDAFTYGLPGAYRIALPPKLALRPMDQAVFDPILLHELAHVSHHDVALAWLARGAWLAVLPLACVPLIISAVTGDFSITFDYVWRAVVVLVVVWLVANEVLRVREHEADVAVGEDPEQLLRMEALLTGLAGRGLSVPGGGWWSHLWSRARAQHPSPQHRVAVLADPTRMLQPTLLEGFTAALLAATIEPLVRSLLTSALTGTGSLALVGPLAAVVPAMLLGASVGVGIWRAAVYGRVSGRAIHVRGLGLAVGGGLFVGQLLSFAQVAVEFTVLGSLGDAALWLFMGMGATAAVAGMGSMWADLASRVRRAGVHRAVALIAGTLVFALALSGGNFVSDVLAWGGWSLLFATIVTTQIPLIVGMLLLGVVVIVPLVGARAGRSVPGWVAERGEGWSWPIIVSPGIVRVVVVGIACGVGGALAIVIFRAVAGAAVSDAESLGRFFDYTLVAGAAGVVGVVVLSVTDGTRGAAASVLVLPIAATTTLAGFVVLNGALGGWFPPEVLAQFLASALTAATIGAVPFAAVALLARSSEAPRIVVPVMAAPADAEVPVGAVAPDPPAFVGPARRARQRSFALIPAVALVAAVLVGGSIPFLKLTSGGPDPLGATSAEASEQLYLQTVVPQLREGFAALIEADTALAAETENAVIAERIRAEIIPVLHQLEEKADAYDPPTEGLGTLHESASDAVVAFRAGYADLAAAFDSSDAQARDAAIAVIGEGVADLQLWIAGVDALEE